MSLSMVNANDNFPADFPPVSTALLPPADYTLEIVDSDYAPNSKGTGSVLKCKAQVSKGPFTGFSYFLNYSLEHENATSMEIGQRDFAALRRATGVLNPQDTEELHWRPFKVTIGTHRRKDTGEVENVVKQYHFERSLAA